MGMPDQRVAIVWTVIVVSQIMVARMVGMRKNANERGIDNLSALCYAYSMTQEQSLPQNIVCLRKNQAIPSIYDVEIEEIDRRYQRRAGCPN